MRFLSILIYFCIAFFVYTPLKAQKNQIKKLDSLLNIAYKKGAFHGSVLLADKGKIVYQKSVGKANETTGELINEETVFELASVSKQFTAMAIAILKEQGKLAYEDKITKFLPALPYPEITVMQLLHHTSGLADYMNLLGEHWDKTKIATNDDIIKIFAEKKPPLQFIPDTKYEYSNTGYAFLASIIAQASGTSYAKFLEDNIFKPLKMKHTLVYTRRYQPKTIPNYAFGYVQYKNKYVLPDNASEDDKIAVWLDGIVGDGTVNSTLGDLLKWDRALYTTKLVSKENLALVFTSGKLQNGKETGYGFGWQAEQNKKYGKVASHSGSWIGYTTYIERHIDTDKTIIILQNRSVNLPPLKAMYAVLYNLPPEPTKQAITLEESTLRNYVGTYEVSPDFSLDITLEQASLYVQATAQEKIPIFALNETRFFLKVVEAEIAFFKDAENRITHLILYQNGKEIKAIKIN